MRQAALSSPRLGRPRGSALAALLGLLVLGSCSTPASRSTPDAASAPVLQAQGVNDFVPLSKVALPTPGKLLPGGVDYNNPGQVAAAVRLGKALFWDQQAGEYKDITRPLGDQKDANGEQEYAAVTGVACASCHFRAGADDRTDGGVPRQGSVGVIATELISQQRDGDELCRPTGAGLQRTGANTPPAVGAVYYRLQFWDGRASDQFNGHNPFGNASGETSDFPGGVFQNHSSLASQADGPANNEVEMTCLRRSWENLGKKLVGRRPLGTQTVADQDSVFAGYVSGGKLKFTSYRPMIDEAFPGLYPNDDAKIRAFGMIWGQAIQAYERTLRPDQTPLDRYLAGNKGAMSELAAKGLGIFRGKGNCTNCHANTEMSDATVSFARQFGLLRDDGGTQGFHNLGVSDENADPGRQNFSGRVQDRGAFKTPGLRNVGLTAPYMHDGSLRTLDEVIDFYATGGKSVFGKPTPGAKNPHLDEKQKELSLSSDDRRALKAFMQQGLTDPRVAKDAAPFDHPSLSFNDGSSPLCATDASGTKTGTGCR